MLRIVAISLVVLQSFLLAGPVCASHATALESMDCCKDGHGAMPDSAFQNPDADSCCAKCDMGKSKVTNVLFQQGVKPNSHLPKPDLSVRGEVVSVSFPLNTVSLEERWSYQKFTSLDPPPLFLRNESLLI